MKSRRRGVVEPAANGGKRCPALYAGKTCNPEQCGCSHVHCNLVPGTNHIRVFHHRRELFGNSHVCHYDGADNKCECVCGFNLKPGDIDWNARRKAKTEKKQSQDWSLPLWHDTEADLKRTIESWKHTIAPTGPQPVSHQVYEAEEVNMMDESKLEEVKFKDGKKKAWVHHRL